MANIPSKKESTISALVFDKFPHMDFSNKDNQNYDWEKHKTYNFKEEERKREEYRSELLSYSEEKIEELYEPIRVQRIEKQKSEIEAANDILFNAAHMKADYSFWNKADYWTVEEFIALSLGKNPNYMNKKYVESNKYGGGYIKWGFMTMPSAMSYLERFNLLSRTIESNPENVSTVQIELRRMKPQACIEWAESKGIELPQELKLPTSQSSMDLVNRVIEQNKKLLENTEKTLEIVKERNLQIKELQERNAKLLNQLSEKEDSRIIKTLNKILCGIIKGHYKDKNSRVSKIIGTLKREANIEINEKTIRTRIEEALKEDQADKE